MRERPDQSLLAAAAQLEHDGRAAQRRRNDGQFDARARFRMPKNVDLDLPPLVALGLAEALRRAAAK